MSTLRDGDDPLVRGWLADVEARTSRPAVKTVVDVPRLDMPYIPPAAAFDYSPFLGRIDENPIVSIALRWLGQNATQPEFRVGRVDERGSYDADTSHELVGLMAKPNEQQSASAFLSSTIVDLAAGGNAFWIPARGYGGRGPVRELYYVPRHEMGITPAPPGSPRLVSRYWHNRGGVSKPYEPEQVIHFKDGIDPRRPYMGLSRLAHQARSLASVEYGENFTAGNLRQGHSGRVIAPRLSVSEAQYGGVDEQEIGEAADTIRRGASGSNAGGLIPVNMPIDLIPLGGGPEEVALVSVMDRVEGILTAALGMNPVVLALPSSSGVRTFNNSAEYYRQAWHSGLMPLLTIVAETLQMVLPVFWPGTADRVWFDYATVEALRDRSSDKAASAGSLYERDLVRKNEARDMVGLPPVPGKAGEQFLSEAQSEQAAELAEKAAQARADALVGEGDTEGEGEGEDFDPDEDPDPDGGLEAEAVAAKSLPLLPEEIIGRVGLGWGEIGELHASDLDELFTGRELKSLTLAPEAEAIKSLRTAKRAKAARVSARRAAFDEAKHPRGQGGKFAPKPGSSSKAGTSRPKGSIPRHQKLERAARRAEERHRRLAARGVTGRRYEQALDEAIALKRAAAKARRGRAQQLLEARRAGTQGRVPEPPRPPKAKAAKPKRAASDRPKRAEGRRTDRAPKGDPAATADHPPGYLGDLNADLIHFDPGRFQYKMAQTDTKTGAVGSLAGVRRWDPELAGVVAVWKDPADGKVYVVNGHNRLDLAKRLGVERVAVRYLDAPNHVTARAKGALANIAEGRGTSTDAAKFFRDSGITDRAALEARGIPLTEAKTTEGLALAGLPDNLFRRVVDGSLPAQHGAIIGGGGLKPEQQMKVAQFYDKSKGRMTGAELREYVDDARLAGSRSRDDGPGLFGGPAEDESLLGHRVKLIVSVKQRLSREKNLFGTVARKRSAETLEKAGNVIDAEGSGRISAEANEALTIFDGLKRTSLFSGLLNDHAARIAAAKNDAERRKIEAELFDEVRRRVKDAYRFAA